MLTHLTLHGAFGRRLTLPDLTPNPGLWWYFFTEMFDHFRPFFLMVFSVSRLLSARVFSLTFVFSFSGSLADIRIPCLCKIPVRWVSYDKPSHFLYSIVSLWTDDIRFIQTRPSVRSLRAARYIRNIQAIPHTRRSRSCDIPSEPIPRDLPSYATNSPYSLSAILMLTFRLPQTSATLSSPPFYTPTPPSSSLSFITSGSPPGPATRTFSMPARWCSGSRMALW